MIVWSNTVHRGRSPLDIDAHRIKDDLSLFLEENSMLNFGNYSTWDVCDVAWELSANAAEWSRALSTPVVLERGENGMALHIRDRGVGVEEALGRRLVEAFEPGVTSSTRQPKGRGRGLFFLCGLTQGGGVFLVESGDSAVMCLNGRIVSSSKSACHVQGTAASFYFTPTHLTNPEE